LQDILIGKMTKAHNKAFPATALDETIYVGSLDHYLYAINPDGTLKWKYKTGGAIHPSPTIGSDGTIYVGFVGSGGLYTIGGTKIPEISILLKIGSPNIIVSGETKPIDTQGSKPIIENGRTLVPIRSIIEALGGTIEWDSGT